MKATRELAPVLVRHRKIITQHNSTRLSTLAQPSRYHWPASSRTSSVSKSFACHPKSVPTGRETPRSSRSGTVNKKTPLKTTEFAYQSKRADSTPYLLARTSFTAAEQTNVHTEGQPSFHSYQSIRQATVSIVGHGLNNRDKPRSSAFSRSKIQQVRSGKTSAPGKLVDQLFIYFERTLTIA